MGANEDEMPADTESTRLRDRAQSEFQQRRQQASETSTRLRDRANTLFQRRRQQAAPAQEAISEGREQFAGALDLGTDDVEPVQLNDRGTEVGFVPDKSGRNELAERFADDRPFVDADEALVDADPRGDVETRTDPSARDEIAAEARSEFAAEDELTEAGDLDAEVGPGGVESVGFTPAGERRRAARELEADTPLDEVDPNADVDRGDDALELTPEAQRRSAARGLEDEIAAIEQGELDPTSDVRSTDSGFGLSEGRAREAAAARLDNELPDVAVGPDDIALEEGEGAAFEASFEPGGGN